MDIIKITRGSLFTDHYWLKFSEEDSYLEYYLANRAFPYKITEDDVYGQNTNLKKSSAFTKNIIIKL